MKFIQLNDVHAAKFTQYSLVLIVDFEHGMQRVLKLVSAIFYQFFILIQMIANQKL